MASALAQAETVGDALAANGRRVIWPAALGAAAAMAMFAANFVLVRQAIVAGLGAADLVALRYGVAAVFFLPLLLSPRYRREAAVLGLPRTLVLTALGGAPYFLLAASALNFAPAAHGVVLNPGMVTLTAVVLAASQGDRLGRGALLGLPLVLIGLGLVAGDGLLADHPNLPRVWLGDAMLVASGTISGGYYFLVRRWGIGSVMATASISVTSAIAWLPAYALLAGHRLYLAPVGELVLQGMYQGLVAGVVGIVLYTRSVAVIGLARAALFPPLTPVLGTVLAAIRFS